MTRVLYIPSTTTGGVYYYRVYTPMLQLIKQYPEEFDITINQGLKFDEECCEYITKNFDVVIVHNALYSTDSQDRFWKMMIYCKKQGVKFVLDLDDYWDYGWQHPYNEVCRFNAFPDKMMINFRMFDFVTTTTTYFAGVISKYFDAGRVKVFPNAISREDKQFTTEKSESPYVRLGLTGGSSHQEDIKQLLGIGRCLTEKQLDSVELVLCGYDTKNNERITLDENGKVVGKEKIEDKDNWWVKTEGLFKSTFRHYKRIETKSIMDGEYGRIYNDIDVLLVPLNNTQFNSCKSELKFIEAGFTDTAVIASKVKPYSIWGCDGTDCLLVKEPTPECWASAIKKVLNKKGLIEYLKENNRNRIIKERDLESVTDKRAAFLNSL